MKDKTRCGMREEIFFKLIDFPCEKFFPHFKKENYCGEEKLFKSFEEIEFF